MVGIPIEGQIGKGETTVEFCWNNLSANLKEITKALMILYLEDKSHTEFAEIMGMSVSNVGKLK